MVNHRSFLKKEGRKNTIKNTAPATNMKRTMEMTTSENQNKHNIRNLPKYRCSNYKIGSQFSTAALASTSYPHWVRLVDFVQKHRDSGAK